MATGVVFVLFGLLLMTLAVVDWRVGGLQLWWRVRMFRRFSRGQALVETYDGLRGSIGARAISILIALIGSFAVVLGLIRLMVRTP